MTAPRLKILLDDHCLLSAVSRTEDGVLSFEDERFADTWHNGARRIDALLPPDAADRLASLGPADVMELRVNLVETVALAILLDDTGAAIVSDGHAWWMPLSETTIGDLLEETDLERFAEPLDVADPFHVPA